MRALPILKEVFGGEREERCQNKIQNQIQSWYQNYDMEITKNTASPCTVGNYPLLLHWSPSQLFWSIRVWRNTGFYNLIRDINVNIWNQWRNPWLLTMIRKTNGYFAVILTMLFFCFFYHSLIDSGQIFIIGCIDVNQSWSVFVFLANNSRLELTTALLYEKALWSFCGAKVDKMKSRLVW